MSEGDALRSKGGRSKAVYSTLSACDFLSDTLIKREWGVIFRFKN